MVGDATYRFIRRHVSGHPMGRRQLVDASYASGMRRMMAPHTISRKVGDPTVVLSSEKGCESESFDKLFLGGQGADGRT